MDYKKLFMERVESIKSPYIWKLLYFTLVNITVDSPEERSKLLNGEE